ncbi:MAG: murein biosynthesis integral membrane protein MurJ [Myxococcales bacterium]|jgi:putative peptidoglycan lipid II flippase|nr:murein biosynthesis integral membrane protein MurJ [Myxococcales bacterium]
MTTDSAERTAHAADTLATAPEPVASEREPPSGLIRSTAIVSAATTASRFLGLIREQLFAALLGAGMWADAFVVAFRIPNLLRDLFAEGALSAAFVPTFAKVEKEAGPEEAHALANELVGALLVIVGVLTLLGAIFAEQLVFLLASGFFEVPGKAELTALLARIMMPFLLALSLAAVMMGMLNARRVFGTPALAPAMFNLTAIAVGVALRLAGASDRTAVIGWSIGTLCGGVAQFAVQLPSLRRFGYAFRPRLRALWRDPNLRRIALLMAPATLGLAATEANIFINTQFASQQPGANAWLNYAFRVMYVPIGIFGVAVATVTTTRLARSAAERDLGAMKAGLGQGLSLIGFLALPSMIGLAVLAEPVIRLLYQYGRFTPEDARHTALALAGYALGLFAYSGIKVAAPAFYALNRPRVPLLGSVMAVVANLALNLLLFERIGYLGLAIGTSLGAWLNFSILATAFGRHTRDHRLPRGFFRELAKMFLCAASMGLAVWGALRFCDALLADAGLDHGSFAIKLVRALGGVGVGILVYGLLSHLLRVEMLAQTSDAIRRKLKRGQAR